MKVAYTLSGEHMVGHCVKRDYGTLVCMGWYLGKVEYGEYVTSLPGDALGCLS